LTHRPSIDDQIAADLKTFVRDGYTFSGDELRQVAYKGFGTLQFGTQGRRSKNAQLRAGGEDRRPTDHGGHLIAGRFNGPGEWFNVIAQDGDFNNRAYKRLENEWDRLGRAGHEIFVDVTAHHKGASKRPYELKVMWKVDGRRFEQIFPNEAGKK
jgi:hypothetical protein